MYTIANLRTAGRVLVIVLLAVLLLTAGCIDIRETPLPDVVTEEMNETFSTVYEHVQFSMDAMGRDVENTAVGQSGYSYTDPFLNSSLQKLRQTYPWAQWAVRYDRNGTVVAGYPVYGADTPYLRDSSVTENAFADTGYLLSQPKINTKGMDLMSVSAPVYTSSGEYDGYVTLEIDPWMYTQQMMRETNYPGYQIWMIDASGIVYSSPEGIGTGENVLISPVFADSKHAEIIQNIQTVPEGVTFGKGYDSAYIRMIEKVFLWKSMQTGGKNITVIMTEPVEEVPVVYYAADNNLTSMKDIATNVFSYAESNGQEKTLAALSDPKSRFILEEGAVFAYDVNGTLLANTERDELIGESFLNYHDGYGVETIQLLIRRSSQGGGYVPYYYPVNGKLGENTALLCLIYVQPVNETWFVGAVQPLSSTPVPYNISKRDEALDNVLTAFTYLEENGKDATLAAFMDPEDIFLKQGIRMYAVDRNGTILSDGKRPYNVGKNGFFFIDRYGGSQSRIGEMTGMNGGGYMLSLHDAPNGGIRVVLEYIKQVDDEWVIGTTVELGTVAETM
ncbi:hypothetical protein McpSp1_04030 [Methanocorpusculaceae archaeon Sp1]|nr:hypothetical protein [Methanocorpusculaceae archaeon Sp1]